VSQGFYLLLDFSSTRDSEVNVQNPAVLAQNWGNFWKILTDIPAYKDQLAGRIFPDLVNEPRYVIEQVTLVLCRTFCGSCTCS
jgi:hypothetical protein